VKGHTNWAKPAAIVGFTAAGAVLLMGLVGYAVSSNEDPDTMTPGRALMLVSVAVTAAAGPVTFAGGSSARWTRSITGSRGLRVVGWIGYGVGLLFELVSAFYSPLRIVAGAVGAGALVCFGVDALYSANEAADVAEMARAPAGFRLAPTLSLLRGPAGLGGGGASLGIAGSF
jgi:hypothetical protein